MKILCSTTVLIFHAAACIAVLNKGLQPTLEDTPAKDEVQQAGYQYNGPAQNYLPPNLQQGYQYVVPVANYQPSIALVGAPVYQQATATQALAVDVNSALPNKLPSHAESETYFIAKEQHKTVNNAGINRQPAVNVNPGYAPPVYHSTNYYVPRQQQLVTQSVEPHLSTTNYPTYEHIQNHREYFAESPEQHDSRDVSSNNADYTSNRISQYTSDKKYPNSYDNGHPANCGSLPSDLQNDHAKPVTLKPSQAMAEFHTYQNVRPIYQTAPSAQLPTEQLEHGNVQIYPQRAISNSHNNLGVTSNLHYAQSLPNSNVYQNERPTYQSVSLAHAPAVNHQEQRDSQVSTQATASGSRPRPEEELEQQGYHYKYQYPSFSPSAQTNSNEFNPNNQHSDKYNENNYAPNTVQANPAVENETPRSLKVPHYSSPLHTQVSLPAIRILNKPQPSQTSASNYASNHKGLGHYSYTQNNPVALTAKDELLTGEQYPKYVNPYVNRDRDYLQMQSDSFELPTYTSSAEAELPVATDYAKQRLQGSQTASHYPVQLNTKHPHIDEVVPQAHYGAVGIENIATPANRYLPPSVEVKPPYV